jgi:AraC-like DNA-binding protein
MSGDARVLPSQRYRFVPSSPDLRLWVSYYVIVDDRAPGVTVPTISYLPAMPGAELYCNLEGVPSVFDRAGVRHRGPRAVFAGPRTRLLVTANDCTPVYALVIGFRVGGWWDLVYPDPASLVDDYAIPDDVLGDPAQDLMARLEYHGERSIVTATEDWLRQLIRRRGVCERETLWLRERMLTDSPAAVAADTGLSRRQLDRRFRRIFGLTPKSFQRLARLEVVHRCGYLSQQSDSPAQDAAQLAAYAGYYDQSHLDRDMRAFDGLSLADMRAQLDRQAPEFDLFQRPPPHSLF